MNGTESRQIRVLYIEDDPGLARLVQRKLERKGYVVDLASDGVEGIARCQSESFDLVAVDQEMPGYSGLDVIQILTAQEKDAPPIVMITGNGSEQIAVEAMKRGASDYIVKDIEGGYLDLLPTVIKRALEQKRLREAKRRAEEALFRYAAELEARNEELDAFAHTVAHDLKGALGQVVGYAQVLAEDPGVFDDESLARYLQRIAKHGRKMSSIIDELLLLASVRKAGSVQMTKLDMSAIVHDALERLDYLVEGCQAKIIFPETWPLAWGYGPWVEEVWLNYLSNAIKYGGNPPIVTLGAIKKDDAGWVRFWVRDNGAGLTGEERARLFTPFTRLDRVGTKGHGLGLSIVRRIVDKLGGQVGIESVVGEGSLFWFSLPAESRSVDDITNSEEEDFVLHLRQFRP
ncbi:MAG TPA: hybrid sensor histidine kinase/response regulator [Chloroflexi bacterium]|nr:hybrid sensor histidine kinase/response regulator [Chloroflexota bacterium]